MMTPEEMAEDIDRMAHLSNSDSIKSFTREKLVPRLDSVPRKCPNCKNSAKQPKPAESLKKEKNTERSVLASKKVFEEDKEEDDVEEADLSDSIEKMSRKDSLEEDVNLKRQESKQTQRKLTITDTDSLE